MKFYAKIISALIVLLIPFIVAAYAMTPSDKVANEDNEVTITSKINKMYAADKELDAVKIEVHNMNGIIHLKGALDTDSQYEKAVMLAGSVKGVDEVNADLLTVKKSEQPLTDVFITAKVKGLLIKNKILDTKDIQYWPINIETKNGVVYISGTIDKQVQKENIIEIIHSIDGVTSINTNGLIVK